MLRGTIILMALGGVWALASDQVTWPRWLLPEIAAVFSSMDRKAPRAVEQAAPARPVLPPPASADPMEKPAALDAPPPQSPPLSAAAAPLATGAIPSAAADTDESTAAPLPPPTADPADPYQMRAAAVGLHPDLSRVLLTRLSPTDYHNAGVAIRTALAETPDSAIFVWPRQRKPEQALFQVRFVPGAASGCRRYVVTVTKDGWLTTAPPMENCGSVAGQARRG